MINHEKFDRVIENLCMNALKFTHPDGKIVIITKLENNNAYIHFIDNGIGMDEKILSQLFAKYSKAGRKGTSGEESTGLVLLAKLDIIFLYLDFRYFFIVLCL